jgi:hypothetical protein
VAHLPEEVCRNFLGSALLGVDHQVDAGEPRQRGGQPPSPREKGGLTAPSVGLAGFDASGDNVGGGAEADDEQLLDRDGSLDVRQLLSALDVGRDQEPVTPSLSLKAKNCIELADPAGRRQVRPAEGQPARLQRAVLDVVIVMKRRQLLENRRLA